MRHDGTFKPFDKSSVSRSLACDEPNELSPEGSSFFHRAGSFSSFREMSLPFISITETILFIQ